MRADHLRIKRAYEPPGPDDGFRVLVERLWPRGVAKVDAKIDAWFKDIAPSTELRKWYHHDVARWPEFKRRYQAELRANVESVEPLLERSRHGVITLIYAARDQTHYSAVVLREFLARGLHSRGAP